MTLGHVETLRLMMVSSVMLVPRETSAATENAFLSKAPSAGEYRYTALLCVSVGYI